MSQFVQFYPQCTIFIIEYAREPGQKKHLKDGSIVVGQEDQMSGIQLVVQVADVYKIVFNCHLKDGRLESSSCLSQFLRLKGRADL